jgi:hypothetical protein
MVGVGRSRIVIDHKSRFELWQYLMAGVGRIMIVTDGRSRLITIVIDGGCRQNYDVNL